MFLWKKISGKKIIPNKKKDNNDPSDVSPKNKNDRTPEKTKVNSMLNSMKGNLMTIYEQDNEEYSPQIEDRYRTPTNSSTTSAEEDDASVGDKFLQNSLHFQSIYGKYKNLDNNFDELFLTVEKIEQVVWSCLNHENKTGARVKFDSLDVSSLPPPDNRNLDSITPVEALAKHLLEFKDIETRIFEDAKAQEVCREILSRLTQHPKQPGERLLSRILKNFVQKKEDQEAIKTGAPKGFFDEELKFRISSIIRFYLRITLNTWNGFAPIVLKSQTTKHYEIFGYVDPHIDLNVAALFHQALIVVTSKMDENQSYEEYLKRRSARRYIRSILKCIERIEVVDQKRKIGWKNAQHWAAVLTKAFPGDDDCVREWAQLSNLDGLQVLLFEDEKFADVILLKLKSNQNFRNEKNKSLRSIRAANKASSSRYFPDIAFILDTC